MRPPFRLVGALLVLLAASQVFGDGFSADCTNGETNAEHCQVAGGIIQAPTWWWTEDFLWRIGPRLVLQFDLSDSIPNKIELYVRHTGSWGENEFTLGCISVSGNAIVTRYVPSYHMEIPDTLSIPRAYLHKGTNTIVFSLTGSDFVWWIRSIESSW